MKNVLIKTAAVIVLTPVVGFGLLVTAGGAVQLYRNVIWDIAVEHPQLFVKDSK